jgi:UDP-glucose 4-epimerase
VHKLAIEQRLIDFARDRGLRSVSLRYFNAAGADVDAGIGEAHDPETHLIPRVLDVALGRRSAVEIFGVNYPTPDGTCIRDFIHVCDIADAHLLALKMLERRSGAHRFNLGTGTGYSVKQVIECARATTEHKLPIVVRPPRPGDPPMLVSDGTLACAELGWRPWRSTLAEQTRDAWRWHRGHFGMA